MGSGHSFRSLLLLMLLTLASDCIKAVELICENGFKEGSHFYHLGDGGYAYHASDESVTAIYFKCVFYERGCRGRAIYKHTGSFTETQPHIHTPDADFVGERHFRENILNDINGRRFVNYQDILDQFRSDQRYSRKVRCKMTLARLRGSMRRTHMARYPKIPQTMRDLTRALLTHDFISKTIDDAENMYAGSCTDAEGCHHIAFFSPRMLQFMSNLKIIQGDGTFKSRPALPSSRQVFVLVTTWDNVVVPLGWFLMASKSRAAYTAVFNLLRHLCPNLDPDVIISDWEWPQQQAWQETFPTMDTLGVLGSLLAAVPVWWWAQGAAAAAFSWIVYYYLLMPLDWTKDLCDVGFEPSRRGWRVSHSSRSAVLREAQRRRRIGNLPPVYPNGWFAVIESSRLPCGRVEHVAALGQNLAVFRGASGAVHVLDAYCPHMGANMAEGGLVHGDCLRCPFHEWSFSGLDGKCTTVPYAQKVPDFARVKRWESLETNGYVFVWHHAEGEPPSWWPQPVTSVVDGSWAFVGRNEFLVSCHIQEIPENGADVAHLNAVHGPGMMGLSALSRHLWTAQWSPGAEPDNQHSAVLQLDHEMLILGKARLFKMSVRANQIGPGYVELFMETTFGPIVMLQSVTPVEPLLQKVVHRMYCPPYLVPYAKFVLYGECVMFERDVLVWNHKKFEDKPLLVKEDRQISRYRRWYSQFYSENSPKHSFHRDTMEW